LAKKTSPGKATYFKRPADFRKWLEANHESESELLVGFHKRDSGRDSITWPESVSEALCFGWIDGVRRRVDDDSYTIRFTPRKATSIWSTVNITKMNELIASELVHPAGMHAFERRSERKSSIYSYENSAKAVFDAESERAFKRNKAAWKFFESCPPWYRRMATWRIVSAKRPETRAKRLAELITCCAEGRSLPTLSLSRDPLKSRAKPRTG
jgi:uncharacterized protein YdeI (YjbR/CyaY-like superfamily)